MISAFGLMVAVSAALFGLALVLALALHAELGRRRSAERKASAAETKALTAAAAAQDSEPKLGGALSRLDATIRHSADAQFTAVRRADGQFVYDTLNEKTEELTGLRAADLLGKTPEESLPSAVAQPIAANWHRAIQERCVLRYT